MPVCSVPLVGMCFACEARSDCIASNPEPGGLRSVIIHTLLVQKLISPTDAVLHSPHVDPIERTDGGARQPLTPRHHSLAPSIDILLRERTMRVGLFSSSHAVVLVSAFLLAETSSAVSQVNPDISVIPRFLLSTDDGQFLPSDRKFVQPKLTLDEFEIAIQGYLNPYVRADVFLAKGSDEEEPVELEEVYASFLRGLPFDVNGRIGKYLVDFGKLNMQHPHMWPFVTKPLSLERFLGDEGLNDLGVSLSMLLPTGEIYSRLSVDVLMGHPVRALEPDAGDVAGGIGMADTTGKADDLSFAGRLMAFFPISEFADLEVGISALSGVHDPYRSERFMYGNVDFKYKWKPNLYTSVTVQGEYLLNRRRVIAGSHAGIAGPSEDIQTSGLYLYADYQFQKIYAIGGRVDWSQSPYAADDKARAVSVFAGFYPVEESSAFRLHLQRTSYETPVGTTDVHSIALQFIFSLGPHKAHPF